MNTMETICSRKSVRSYTGEPITAEELNTILKAANAAPVGMGQYNTLHLTVITNKALLDKMEKATAMLFGKPDMHPLYNAPTLVLVSSKKPEPGMENVAYSNAAILVHNMALAATELGVGQCDIWGAVAAAGHDPEILAELDLPEGFIPCCGICLGKTTETYALRDIPLHAVYKCRLCGGNLRAAGYSGRPHRTNHDCIKVTTPSVQKADGVVVLWGWKHPHSPD